MKTTKYYYRRRSITMPESLSRRIRLAADYLGLSSSEDFIQLAIENQLADVAANEPALRRLLNR